MYVLPGNKGKATVAEAMTASLDDMVNSVHDGVGMIMDKDELIDNSWIIYNLVLVCNGHQYFVDDARKVQRRDDGYMVGVRPLKTRSVIGNKTVDGYAVDGDVAMTPYGPSDEFKYTGDLVPIFFPGSAWLPVDGVCAPGMFTYVNKTYAIKSVECMSSLYVDLLGVLPEMYSILHVTEGSSQKNIINVEADMYVLYNATDLRQARYSPADNVVVMISKPDNSMEILKIGDIAPDAMVKADYWKGEILRITVVKDDHPFVMDVADGSVMGIDQVLTTGVRVVRFHVGNPGAVIRPSSVRRCITRPRRSMSEAGASEQSHGRPTISSHSGSSSAV